MLHLVMRPDDESTPASSETKQSEAPSQQEQSQGQQPIHFASMQETQSIRWKVLQLCNFLLEINNAIANKFLHPHVQTYRRRKPNAERASFELFEVQGDFTHWSRVFQKVR